METLSWRLTLECTYIWCIEVEHELEKGIDPGDLTLLIYDGKVWSGVKWLQWGRMPIGKEAFADSLGNGLNNVAFERNNIGSEN